MANLQGPERWQGTSTSRARLAPHLKQVVYCRRISESSPPKIVVIALKCSNLLWGHGRENFQIPLCEPIFPADHNSQENLRTDRAWRVINGARWRKVTSI